MGVPQVQPSFEVCLTASASGLTPASFSRSAIRTPLHQAFPIRSPPTGLETQQIVTQVSVSCRFSSSA